MSSYYASDVLGIYADSPIGGGGQWSGWRKVLTTDQYGHLCNWDQAYIGDLTVGDSYSIQLSGPIIPDTELVAAVLDVDTDVGIDVFEVAGNLTADGEAGTYAVGFFFTPTLTSPLSRVEYRWSVRISSSSGDVWTPVDQSPLIPN